MIEFVILFTIVLAILLFLYLYEKNRNYNPNDFKLKYISCEDNSYYFALPMSFYQFKKYQIAKELYAQGTIVENEFDNSKHIITRWGDFRQGQLRIFAQPFIPQLNQQLTQINIQNYGIIDLTFFNQQKILEIVNTIKRDYSDDDNSMDAISTLENISEKNPVDVSSLQRLIDFIKKYEPILSLATDIFSIISGILGIVL